MLTSVAELIQTGGVQSKDERESPRSRGIRIGIFMLLLLIVVAPILGMLSVFVFRTTPWPMGVSIFLLGGGGILRIAYALMFESSSKALFLKNGKASDINSNESIPELPNVASSLPPQPASAYARPNAGKWPDTNDLEPVSVTENTTKLLEKDR